MFEVDDVMRFYLFLIAELLLCAVLDKFPITLVLVLIHNRNSILLRLLYYRPVSQVLFALMALRKSLQLTVLV